ncbi:MFS transporter [Sphingomonas sp.]|uniref:MFS transporter n=1 Tax=Sphingomonas sp. TaxID=28214 RepID=UPI002EDAB703
MGRENVRRSGAPGRAYAYYVLAVLCLANILASADRYAFFVLIQPIKREFQASDAAIGFVSGMAFILFYVLLGIPVARWVDRGNRRNILAASVAIWSLVTMLGGMAASMVQLGASRAGLGAGEAGAVPASQSLIADYFPKADRPAAVSVFQAGMAISAIVSAGLVGLIAQSHGWRMALIAMGAPGLLVALLIFLTVREPMRGAMDQAEAAARSPTLRPGWWAAIMGLLKGKAFRYLFLSQIGAGIAAGILPVWLPIYFMRAYGLTLPQVGAVTGFLMGAVMLASFTIVGFIGTLTMRRGMSERTMSVIPAVASAAAVPLLCAVLLTGPFATVLALASVYFFCQFATRPAAFTLSIELVPADQRGLSAAVIVIANSLIGAGFGPMAAGMISDALTPSMGEVAALRTALLAIVPAAMALCALGFIGVFRHMPGKGSAAIKPDAATA